MEEMNSRRWTMVELALRERLMDYYKEVGGQYLISVSSGLSFPNDTERIGETQHQYQRQLRDLRRPKLLKVGGEFIGSMARNPAEFIFTVNRERSPQMTFLTANLEQFFLKYLPAVTLDYKPRDRKKCDDSTLLDRISLQVQTQLPERSDYDEYQDNSLYTAAGITQRMVQEYHAAFDGNIAHSMNVRPSVVWSEAQTVSIPMVETEAVDELTTRDNPF